MDRLMIDVEWCDVGLLHDNGYTTMQDQFKIATLSFFVSADRMHEFKY